MRRKLKLLLGAAIVLAALVYLVVEGLKEAVVYFMTPSGRAWRRVPRPDPVESELRIAIMPTEPVERGEFLREPKKLIWYETGHMDLFDRELIRALTQEVVAELRAAGYLQRKSPS
mgnify:CR=1 FL=1